MASHTPKIAAFSLMELIVVIAIIGIIAATGIPSYVRYLQRAYLAEAVSVLGEYKTAIGIYWSTVGNLPTTGTTLRSTPADLPFGTLVTTNLPSSIESIQLTSSGNGILITVIINSNIFSALPTNNRRLFLGAKGSSNDLSFKCGNFTTDAAASADFGFTDRSILPKGCDYNGVGEWLST